jgi:hypothetical protein
MFVDFDVTRKGLRYFGDGIIIPIILPAMTNEHASVGFELSDEVFTLHRGVSSASFLTPGISPLVRSKYRSRRWA